MRFVRALAMVVAGACLACGDRPRQSEATVTAYPPAPAGLDLKVSSYLDASKGHQHNVWRDVDPLNGDGTVNGYIEIARGDSTKWEFRIPRNRREVDRMIPQALGGYPVNYGFMPRTISYDGDPADVVFLGPPLAGGEVVKGRILGVMHMTDTGDLDSKVVASPLDARGAAAYTFEADDRARMARFFDTYKDHEGKPTRVTGWGDEADARRFIGRTRSFFDLRSPGR
jgi:inorganic pyrophosphatase